jgi:surface protein
MFYSSKFNNDISSWDVSSVENMDSMFIKSKFNGDVSNWKPYSLNEVIDIFPEMMTNLPDWFEHKEKEKRHAFLLSTDLQEKKTNNIKKIKI